MRNRLWPRLGCLLAACLAVTVAWGYDIIRNDSDGALVTYNPGTIPTLIKVGTDVTLEDGTNFSTTVLAAMTEWNPEIGAVQFAGTIVEAGPGTDGDGVNEIIFNDTIYGEAYGENTLAVTLSWVMNAPRPDGTYQRTQSDILFNTAKIWNSYRGAHRYGGPYDMRRVAIHELGHVLGLGHPDEAVPPQSVTAIMNSTISNIDAIKPDDRAGAQYLYGPGSGTVNRPANDDLAAAYTVNLVNNAFTWSTNNYGGTKESGEPNHAPGEPGGSSVWWKWTAPGNGSMTITTAGSYFDTMLAAYTGSAVNALSQIASNDDVQSGVVRTSSITFTASAGTTFYIAVDGWEAETGLITLNLNFTPEPANTVPSITGHPSNQTVSIGQSAQFTVSAAGRPAPSYRWQRLPIGNGTWSDLYDGGSFAGTGSATLTISGVTSSMNGDQFRCVASNALGSAVSNPAVLNTNVINGVARIAAGAGHTAFVRTDGSFWSMGYNFYGQLGGYTEIYNVAIPRQFNSSITYISGGHYHNLVIKLDRSLWSFGYNHSGQLGDGTLEHRPIPVFVAGDVVSAAAGLEHSLYVKSDGTLWGMGENLYGQLGGSAPEARLVPVQLAADVSMAAAGAKHSLFLKHDGTLWAMGSNKYGQFGDGTNLARTSPVRIAAEVQAVFAGAYHTLYIKTDGTLWTCGEWRSDDTGMPHLTYATPVQVATGVVAASAGYQHDLFLKSDGSLWAMGYNYRGMLGDGTTVDRMSPVQVGSDVMAFAAGRYHSAFIKTDGTLWCMGSNFEKQLGDGTNTDHWTPVQIVSGLVNPPGIPTNLAASNGMPIPAVRLSWNPAIGATYYEIWRHTINDPAGAEKIASWHASTLFDDRTPTPGATYYYWVRAVNSAGGGGFSTPVQGRRQPLPPAFLSQPAGSTVEVGQDATFAVLVAGSPPPSYQWQRRSAGGLPWDDMAEGGDYSGVTTNELKVKASSTGMHGDEFRCVATNFAGTAISDAVVLGVNTAWAIIKTSAGLDHSLFIRSDGSLWTLGGNLYGQLGDGTKTDRMVPIKVADNVVAAVARYRVSLFIKADGTLWAMGANIQDRLGSTLTQELTLPVQIANDVIAVDSGNGYTVYLRSDGTLWKLGFNWFGPSSGTGSSPIPVQVASEVAAVAAADGHCMFIKYDGTLWGTGSRQQGRIGDGVYSEGSTNAPVLVANNVRVVGLEYYATYFVRNDGKLWGAGRIPDGTLGQYRNSLLPVELAAGVRGLASGGSNLQFIKTDHTLWGAGYNANGQLGDGTVADRFEPIQTATNVATIASGTHHSLFAKLDGSLWGMGSTGNGRLGLPGDGPQASPILIKGGIFPEPTAPSSIAASKGLTNIYVRLRWTPVLGATGYQVWRNTSDSIVGATMIADDIAVPLYYDTSATELTTYHYWVKAISPNGISPYGTSDTGYRLQVIPPAVVTQPAAQSFNAGWNAAFNATFSGDPAPALRWQRWASSGSAWIDLTEGAVYTGVRTPTLTVNAVTLAMSGDQFRCVASNIGGSVASEPAILTVAPAPGVTNIAAMDGRTFFIRADGSLWGMGANESGQLGLGTTSTPSAPSLIATNVVSMAAGGYQSVFIKVDGTLWAMGANYGTLGDGTSIQRIRPVQVAGDAVAVSSGIMHSMFIKSDGTLWAVGENSNGRLGDGTTTTRSVPVCIASNVMAVAAGGAHSLFLKADRTLWVMGYNAWGQLGDGSTVDRLVPVQVATNVRAVAAGYYHSLFIKEDDTLWTMGQNSYGQLGDGTTIGKSWPVQIADNVRSCTAGSNHSAFIKTDGSLWSMGFGAYFQLGQGASQNLSTPVMVVSDVLTVAAGSLHTIFVKPDGSLWGMGSNNLGQLPQNTNTSLPLQFVTGTLNVPPVPDSLQLNATPGSSMVRLSAGTVLGASHYEFWRNTTGDIAGASRVADEISAPIYYDATTNQGVNYYYWIRSINGAGPSEFSPPVALHSPPTIVQQPQSVTADLGNSVFFVVETAGYLAVTHRWERLPEGSDTWMAVANDGSYTGADTATLGISPTTSGMQHDQYRCVISNSAGSVTSATAWLNLFFPITVNRQPLSKYAVIGSSVEISVAAESAESLAFQWQKDGVLIPGATSAVLMIPSFQIDDVGRYRVVVSNSSGSVTSDEAILEIAVAPVITSQPQGQTVYAGQGGAFTATATSTTTLSYIWRKDGSPIPGATQATYTIPIVQSADAGSYSVDVTNIAGTVTSQVAVLTVIPIVLPVITQQPISRNFVAGTAAQFTVAATGLPAPGYQWQVKRMGDQTWNNTGDGARYAGSGTAMLTVSDVQSYDHLDQYRCVATNQAGSAISEAATLTVTTGAAPVGLASGYAFSLFRRVDGSLWGMGGNAQGQLADGTGNSKSAPGFSLSGVADVAAGAFHTLMLKGDATLWSSGLNTYGALGTGDLQDHVVPQVIANGVAGLSAGVYHSLFVKQDGTLWGMGWNTNGQLGNGAASESVTQPVQVADHVLMATAGYVHSIFVKLDGTVWAAGYGGFGQFGNGSPASSTVPMQVGEGMAAVASGYYHTLFLGKDGSLWSSGTNAQGQLGDGTYTDRSARVQIATGVVQITAALNHSLFVKADGTLWAMGDNSSGQLGDGTATNRAIPVQVASNVTSVSTGFFHTLFIKADGSLWGMGSNGNSQLGSSAGASQTTPVEIARGGFTVPGKPGSLSATNSALLTSVRLTWMPVSGVSHYEVWRGTTADPVSAVRLAGYLKSTLYEDSTGNAGVPYHYRVRALQPDGHSTSSDPALGSQGAIAPSITTHPQSRSVNVGSGYTFTVAATGTGPLLYQWRKDGVTLPGAVFDNYPNTATFEQAGSYDVVVTNTAGTVTSNAAVLTVNQLTQTITFAALPNRPFSSAPVQLNAVATSGLPVRFSLITGPAALLGHQLTLTGTGLVTVRASQAGDASYAAAPDQDRSFTVTASFASWGLPRFTGDELNNAAVSGPNADPDGDGYPNLVEYALGLEPKVNSAAGLPEVTADATHWIYTYTRPEGLTDITCTVEVSADLSGWGAPAVAAALVSASGGIETWQAKQPLTSANAFFRLKVSQ